MATVGNSGRAIISNDAVSLELIIGTPAIKFLDEYCLDLLLCSRRLLRAKYLFRKSDYSPIVMPAAKAFEGFLRKLIQDKKLSKSSKDEIGKIFSADTFKASSHPVNKQLRNKKYGKIILKISAEWDFCRNKIMHYDEDFKIKDYKTAERTFQKILDAIKESYVAYIGETGPSEAANLRASKMLSSPAVTSTAKSVDEKFLEAMYRRYSQPKSDLQRIYEEIAKTRIKQKQIPRK